MCTWKEAVFEYNHKIVPVEQLKNTVLHFFTEMQYKMVAGLLKRLVSEFH